MATDMTLTLNALPARDPGKDVRRSTEKTPVAQQQAIDQATGKPVVSTSRSQPVASQSADVPVDQLRGAVSQMKDFAQMLNRELQFDVDDELGRTVVRVVDKDSGKLIRQIPSDEVLALARQMKEMREAEAGRVDGKGTREQPVGLLVKLQA